jgi:hypothetical protein
MMSYNQLVVNKQSGALRVRMRVGRYWNLSIL